MRTSTLYSFVSIVALYGFIYLSLSLDACLAEEPDAKSIPKPILMLGLYCNSSMSTLKLRFESDPHGLPWRADDEKRRAIQSLMDKLDLNDLGYTKSVRDKALTQGEANFLKFSAVHETDIWFKNITSSCKKYIQSDIEVESCLKEANSEVYKCYRQIIDTANAIIKKK